jgi:polysaccharide pyruvyl transferase WcaK-like protein
MFMPSFSFIRRPQKHPETIQACGLRNPARAACRQLADSDLIVSSRFHVVVAGNIMGKAMFGVYAGDYSKHKMLAAAQDFHRIQALSRPEMNAANAMLKAGWSKS